MKVGVLGAEGTGKTTLAAQLAGHVVSVAEGAAPPFDTTTLAQLQHCSALLVMGLDLPSAAGQGAADAQLRSALAQAGLPYRVVYGQGQDRLAAALQALGLARPPEDASRSRAWSCEACSDPDCEHRLFTGLVATGRRN